MSEVYKHGKITLYSFIGQWFNFIYLFGIFFVIYCFENKEDFDDKIKEN